MIAFIISGIIFITLLFIWAACRLNSEYSRQEEKEEFEWEE